MKKVDIYFKTIGFCFLRILFYLLAITAAILIIIIIGVIGVLADMNWLVYVGYVISFAVFTVLVGKASKNYNAAHIAEITDGLVLGEISNHPIKDGKEKMQKEFSTFSPLQLFFKVFSLIYQKIKKKNIDRGLIPEIKSFALFTLSMMIPFLGPCCMAWTFSHDDDDVLKSYLDAIGAFFHNFKQMIGIVILNFLFNIFIVAIFTIALVILAVVFIQDESFVMLVGETINLVAGADAYTNFLTAVVIISFAISYYGIFELIHPIFNIIVIDKYLRVTKENPENGQLYAKITGITDTFKSNIHLNDEVQEQELI